MPNKRKARKTVSFYTGLAGAVAEGARHRKSSEKIDLGVTIRKLREERKMKGVEVCRRAGDLDARTLTAIEKGRIKNPSVATLLSVSRGLGVTVSDLFREAESGLDRNFYVGSPKGVYTIDFPSWGIKAISYTPFTQDFFCGKILVGSKKTVDKTLFRHPLPLFISVVVGHFEITVEGRKTVLREGQNLYFNGLLKHAIHNPLRRESAFLLVTSPSLFT